MRAGAVAAGPCALAPPGPPSRPLATDVFGSPTPGTTGSQIFSAAGNQGLVVAAQSGQTKLAGPHGISLDSHGRVNVRDNDHGRLLRLPGLTPAKPRKPPALQRAPVARPERPR